MATRRFREKAELMSWAFSLPSRGTIQRTTESLSTHSRACNPGKLVMWALASLMNSSLNTISYTWIIHLEVWKSIDFPVVPYQLFPIASWCLESSNLYLFKWFERIRNIRTGKSISWIVLITWINPLKNRHFSCRIRFCRFLYYVFRWVFRWRCGWCLR